VVTKGSEKGGGTTLAPEGSATRKLATEKTTIHGILHYSLRYSIEKQARRVEKEGTLPQKGTGKRLIQIKLFFFTLETGF